MNCQGCQRPLAPSLSICPSCGTMVNDTIREELQSKITVGPRTGPDDGQSFDGFVAHQPMQAAVAGAGNASAALAAAPARMPKMLPKRQMTAQLEPAKTSPTLVRFNDGSKSKIPDWRAKLKESVKQRRNGDITSEAYDNVTPMPKSTAPPKAETLSQSPKIDVTDERLANALARIERSRRLYFKNNGHRPAAQPVPRPLSAAIRPGSIPADVAVKPQSSPMPEPQPRVLSDLAPIREVERDTNKLPELKKVEAVAERSVSEAAASRIEVDVDRPTLLEHKSIHIPAARTEQEAHEALEFDAVDEIEDLAPLSMRFAAGLFDLVIAAVAASLMLSPLAFYGFDWVSPLGIGLFIAALAIFLFVYNTLTLGFFGKTLGLRLFALELVDAVENEFPTMKQAAVNSAVYLVSLLFFGAGFVTVFFNDENRAIHDLLSGTILVKEF